MEDQARLIAARFRQRFGRPPEVIASAPGRVNLIGEHTDYNDGFVLPMAIDRRLYAAHAKAARQPGELTVFVGPEGDRSPDLDAEKHPSASASAMEHIFRAIHSDAPAADVEILSDIPAGAGLSSSAALEIACLRGLSALAGVPWDADRMALAAQGAEQILARVQCGIMDPLASAASRSGHAMLLDCRSLERTWVAWPAAVAIVVMDTGTRRRLADSQYNARRVECEQAVARLRDKEPWVRSLRDVTPALLNSAHHSLIPVLAKRARHVVSENARPAQMADALAANDFEAAGALLNESHASLRDLYEVSSQHLDRICEVARAHPACHGARMTGAGFGGCAIALVDTDAASDFISFARPRYEVDNSRKSDFFVVTASEGARLEPLN